MGSTDLHMLILDTCYQLIHSVVNTSYLSLGVSKITHYYVLLTQVFSGAFSVIKSDFELRHVCLPVHMYQLGSHWTDFHEV
jgi:hypothetical protein